MDSQRDFRGRFCTSQRCLCMLWLTAIKKLIDRPAAGSVLHAKLTETALCTCRCTSTSLLRSGGILQQRGTGLGSVRTQHVNRRPHTWMTIGDQTLESTVSCFCVVICPSGVVDGLLMHVPLLWWEASEHHPCHSVAPCCGVDVRRRNNLISSDSSHRQ